jgi:glycosyltransferase involved in cell wall biosynthesis
MLEDTARRLRLGSAVTFLGHRPRDELETLLARAWVQAVPSRWEEPFGLVVAEAMMRGTAVVATDSGGPRELVREGSTGFRVPPGDAVALGRALLRVLRDRDLAERLGAEGRAVALTELTEDRAVDRFVALYERLQDHRPRANGSRPA